MVGNRTAEIRFTGGRRLIHMASDLEELRALADLSPQLVAAAERQDWDALVELGRVYFAAFARLTAGVGDSDAGSERRRLIEGLLADHASIREQAEPWLRSTGKLLGSWDGIAARNTGAAGANPQS